MTHESADARGLSADKAAFFVFEKREGKAALWRLGLIFVLARFVLLLAGFSLAILLFSGQISKLVALGPSSPEFLTLWQSVSPPVQLVMYAIALFFLPVFVAIYTAWMRWMLNGEYGGPLMGLRFGETEMNVLVAFIAIVVLVLLFMVIGAIPLGILSAITAAAWKTAAGGMMLTLSIIYGVAGFAALIWFSVRISVAPALTCKRGKIQIFEAMAVTKGHFWLLFLAYVLQYFVILAASIAVILAALILALPFLGVGVLLFGNGAPSMGHVGAYVALTAVPVLVIIFASLGLDYLKYAMSAGIAACLVSGIDEDSAVAARPAGEDTPA